MLLALCAILLSPLSAAAMTVGHDTGSTMSMTAEDECHGHSHDGCDPASETDCQLACASIAIDAGLPIVSSLGHAVEKQPGYRAPIPPGYSPGFEPPPPRARA